MNTTNLHLEGFVCFQNQRIAVIIHREKTVVILRKELVKEAVSRLSIS
jgi:hypothetical protein